MEYSAAAAVGYSVSPQVEKGGADNGRKFEGFGRMLPWSRLVTQVNVSAGLRARLRDPQLDFELRLDDGSEDRQTRNSRTLDTGSADGNSNSNLVHTVPNGQYWITPVKYHGNEGAAYIVNAAIPATTAFNMTTTFPSVKRWGCRVRCLPSLASPGDLRNILAFNASTKPPLSTASSAALSIQTRYTTDLQPFPTDAESSATTRLDMTVRATPDTPDTIATNEWTRVSVSFSTPLDLSDSAAADATSQRSLGAWINSDGCGATLNVQLAAGVGYAGTSREWYTDLTWMGWQYIRFDQAETSRRLFNYSWPYNQEKSQRGWSRKAVDALNFLVSNVTTSQCEVSLQLIEVFYQAPVAVAGGSLSVSTIDPPLKIPYLAPGQYIECIDMATPETCRVFTANGVVVTPPTQHAPPFNSRQHRGAGSVVSSIRDRVTVSVDLDSVVGSASPTPNRPRVAVILTEASTERIGPFELGP